MKRLLLWIGALGGLFLGVVIISTYYFLFTSSGCQLIAQAISDFSHQTIQVQQVDGHLGKGVHLDGVKIQLDAATIDLEQVQLNWELRKLLAGEVHVTQLLLNGVDLAVASDKRTSPDDPSSFSLPDITFPISLMIDNLQLQDAVISQHGNGEQLVKIDQFQAKVQVKEHTLSLQSVLLQTPAYGGDGEVMLQMQESWPVQLNGNWRVVPPDCNEVKGRVTLAGSIAAPKFSLHVLYPQEFAIHGSIKDLFADPTFTVNGAATAFDPSLLCTSYPKLSVDTSFSGSGSLAHYQVDAQVHLSHKQYGQLESTVQLSGNKHGISLSHSQLNHEESKLRLSGKLDWQDIFTWNLNINVEDLNPAQYALAGEGDINGSIHTTGKWGAQQKTVTVELTELAGIYNGLEVAGQGKGGCTNGHFAISELSVLNGENNLTVQGSVTDSYDLVIGGSIPEIDDFLPKLAGSIQLTGRVTGIINEPVLQAHVGIQEFSMDQLSCEQVNSDFQVALYGENRFEVTGLLEELEVNGNDIQQSQFKIDGVQTDHRISGSLQSDFGNADFTATGGLHNTSLWKGTLHNMALKHPEFGSWSLTQQTGITLSSDLVKVAPLCFNNVHGNVCLEGSWQKGDTWHVAVPSAQLQLRELVAALPVPVSGIVEGAFLAQGNGSTLKELSGRLVGEEIDIAYHDELREQESIGGSGEVQFKLDDQVLHIDLALNEGMGGQLDGHCLVSDVTDLTNTFSSALLDGMFTLNSGDISWLGVLYSDMLVSGEITAEVNIAGQLDAPIITADLTVNDGDIQFPQLGTELSDIHGQLTREADGTLDYTAFASSGDGIARGTGSIHFDSNQWNGTAHLQGSNIELMNKDGLHLWGDPELDFVFAKNGGHLSGTLVIPKAEIQPEESIKSETVSGDVVFVDVSRQDQSWPFTYDIALHLGESVAVKGYGFKGYLDGQLQLTEPERGDMVLGRGSLTIRDGALTLRGSTMKVHEGRIIFNGGPVNNPLFNIELRKEVEPQNIGDEPLIVGVDISGSALDYEVELSSIPAMEDKEILTYILFDRSMDQDEADSSNTLILSALESIGFDQTSSLISEVTDALPLSLSDMQFSGTIDGDDTYIGVRKKMTDDLSIHYDFNLFKSAGRFRVVYQLVKGFSMEITNSVEANGVRLLYSFER